VSFSLRHLRSGKGSTQIDFSQPQMTPYRQCLRGRQVLAVPPPLHRMSIELGTEISRWHYVDELGIWTLRSRVTCAAPDAPTGRHVGGQYRCTWDDKAGGTPERCDNALDRYGSLSLH